MFHFIFLLFKLIICLLFGSNKGIIIQNAILQKENEILKRQLKKRIKYFFFDKLFYSIFNKLSKDVRHYIILIQPKTVLGWQKRLIKRFWTFTPDKSKVGRPPVPKEIKELVLNIKSNNLFWGYGRIQG